MHILIAISILCFFALMLATVAIARRVHARRVPARPESDFAQHLLAAAKAQDSTIPPTLPQQNVKAAIARTSWHHALEPTLASARNQSISSKRL
jgi:hypothetical protein